MSRSKSTRRPPQRAPKRALNRWWWAALLAVSALAVLGVWRLTATTAAANAALEISVTEAAARRDAGAFILDVREPEEWEAGHIPDSTLIPLDQLAARVSELPADQPIVVVCRSGNRSQAGRDILLDAGFEQVTSMAGGLNEWQTLGLPTVTGP